MSILESMRSEATALRAEIQEFLKIDRNELYGEKRLHDVSFNRQRKRAI